MIRPGHDVRIAVDSDNPRQASVKVDGVEHHNVVTAYQIYHRAGEVPELVVLDVIESSLAASVGLIWHDGSAVVALSEETVNLITALGWRLDTVDGTV